MREWCNTCNAYENFVVEDSKKRCPTCNCEQEIQVLENDGRDGDEPDQPRIRKLAKTTVNYLPPWEELGILMHLQAHLVAKQLDTPSLLPVVEDLWLHWLHLHTTAQADVPLITHKNSQYPNPYPNPRITLGILLLACRWLRIPILATTLTRWANEKTIPFPFANHGPQLALNYGWRNTCIFPLRPDTIRKTARSLKRNMELELPRYLDAHLLLPGAIEELCLGGFEFHREEKTLLMAQLKRVLETLRVKEETTLAALIAIMYQMQETGNQERFLALLCKTFDVSPEQFQKAMKTILSGSKSK